MNDHDHTKPPATKAYVTAYSSNRTLARPVFSALDLLYTSITMGIIGVLLIFTLAPVLPGSSRPIVLIVTTVALTMLVRYAPRIVRLARFGNLRRQARSHSEPESTTPTRNSL